MAFTGARVYRGRTLESNSGERAGETVRDAISRRTIDGIAQLVRDVNGDAVTFDMGYRCLLILTDVVSPFVTPDMKRTIDQVVDQWREMAKKEEENRAAAEAHQIVFRKNIAQTHQPDEVVF